MKTTRKTHYRIQHGKRTVVHRHCMKTKRSAAKPYYVGASDKEIFYKDNKTGAVMVENIKTGKQRIMGGEFVK